MGTNAGCGSRTSCPLDGGCSSIFLVFIRRRNPPTGAPTVVLATRWCAERREGADDASARLAAVFRLSGSRNPAAAGRAPPLRFGCRANRSLAPRASATAQTPFFTLEFLPGCTVLGISRFGVGSEGFCKRVSSFIPVTDATDATKQQRPLLPSSLQITTAQLAVKRLKVPHSR